MQVLLPLFPVRLVNTSRLSVITLLLLLAAFFADMPAPRVHAASNPIAPSPALKCKTHLTDVWLPSKLETFAGHTSRNNEGATFTYEIQITPTNWT